MSRCMRDSIAIAVALCAMAHICSAAELRISVTDANGKPLMGAAVIAVANNAAAAPRSSTPPRAVMDQIDKEFVPEILIVRTGTAVLFPNSDSVAHQVYSFSPAKRFALPLYRGRPYPPVIFDQPGIVTLGCNIHDHMVGYIVVSDSPYFGQTDAQGKLALQDLPQGAYSVSAWHPRMSEQPAPQSITLDEHNNTVAFRLSKPLRPARRNKNDRNIRDY